MKGIIIICIAAKSPLKCNENQFDCNKDGTQCISLDNTCDHINDCDNYQDEDSVMCQGKLKYKQTFPLGKYWLVGSCNRV